MGELVKKLQFGYGPVEKISGRLGYDSAFPPSDVQSGRKRLEQ